MKTCCPNCDTTANVPNDRIGSRVKCPACEYVFVAKASDAPEASTARKANERYGHIVDQKKSRLPGWLTILLIPPCLMFLCCGGLAIVGMVAPERPDAQQADSLTKQGLHGDELPTTVSPLQPQPYQEVVQQEVMQPIVVPQAQQAPPEKQWVLLGSWSGTGSMTTEKFRSETGEIRLTWSVERNPNDSLGLAYMHIIAQGPSLPEFPVSQTGTSPEPRYSYIYDDPGRYHLEINATGLWVVVAEELR